MFSSFAHLRRLPEMHQYGTPIDAGPVTWSSTFPEVAVVQPTTGLMLAIASGTTQISATIAGKVGRRTVAVSPPGTSYGRCPDGVGPLLTTLAPTRKAVNACP